MVLKQLNKVIYNPLNAQSDWRCLQIARELKADIVLLPATCSRARDSLRHTWKNLDEKYWMVTFGWIPGALTNKSTGCSIILKTKIFSH